MKFIILFLSILLFVACGNNAEKKENSTTGTATTKSEAEDPLAAKGLALVAKSDCFTCHKLADASIGPPYSAIAAKYKTITPESMDSMVSQISKGGAGRWGTVPMPPHPAISKEDEELMVHYIMSIKH